MQALEVLYGHYMGLQVLYVLGPLAGGHVPFRGDVEKTSRIRTIRRDYAEEGPATECWKIFVLYNLSKDTH
jgi:hypothetical protein